MSHIRNRAKLPQQTEVHEEADGHVVSDRTFSSSSTHPPIMGRSEDVESRSSTNTRKQATVSD